MAAVLRRQASPQATRSVNEKSSPRRLESVRGARWATPIPDRDDVLARQVHSNSSRFRERGARWSHRICRTVDDEPISGSADAWFTVTASAVTNPEHLSFSNLAAYWRTAGTRTLGDDCQAPHRSLIVLNTMLAPAFNRRVLPSKRPHPTESGRGSKRPDKIFVPTKISRPSLKTGRSTNFAPRLRTGCRMC